MILDMRTCVVSVLCPAYIFYQTKKTTAMTIRYTSAKRPYLHLAKFAGGAFYVALITVC